MYMYAHIGRKTHAHFSHKIRKQCLPAHLQVRAGSNFAEFSSIKSWQHALLENVRQCQQHCCQDIFLHFTGILQLSSYILECHIIYLLFTKAFCKSRLSCAESEVYHNVRHHMFSGIYICRFCICLCQEEKYIFQAWQHEYF